MPVFPERHFSPKLPWIEKEGLTPHEKDLT